MGLESLLLLEPTILGELGLTLEFQRGKGAFRACWISAKPLVASEWFPISSRRPFSPVGQHSAVSTWTSVIAVELPKSRQSVPSKRSRRLNSHLSSRLTPCDVSLVCVLGC